MIHMTRDPQQAKDWFLGPWNSPVPIPVGYANQGIHDPHFHAHMYEIYLVAAGTCRVRVDNQECVLAAGDMLVVTPNEVHTFLESSPEYLHFVLQVPWVEGDKVRVT